MSGDGRAHADMPKGTVERVQQFQQPPEALAARSSAPAPATPLETRPLPASTVVQPRHCSTAPLPTIQARVGASLITHCAIAHPHHQHPFWPSPVGRQQHSRPQVLVAVPPVGGAGRGAAGAQDALVQPVQLGARLLALVVLAAAGGEGRWREVGGKVAGRLGQMEWAVVLGCGAGWLWDASGGLDSTTAVASAHYGKRL